MTSPRQKINRHHSADLAFTGSKLYPFFKQLFDYLTSDGSHISTQPEFDDVYVPNGPVEQWIEHYYSSLVPLQGFLIGSTGIGKSTYIKKTFGVTNEFRIVSRGREKVLLIPFHLDKMAIAPQDAKERITARIQYTVTDLCAQNNISVSPDDVAATLRNTGRGELLYQGQPKIDPPQTDPERARKLQTINEYAFWAAHLKHISKVLSITRLIVVVDNIENSDFNSQLEFIRWCMSFVGCFENTDKVSSPVLASVLVACRPATKNS